MRKKSLVFLSALTFVLFGKGQNYIEYFNEANEAEHDFFTSSYEGSKKRFVELENKYNGLKAKDYFYLGVIYYMGGDTVNGLTCMKKSALAYGFPSWKIKEYSKKRPKLRLSKRDFILIDSIEKDVSKVWRKDIKDTLKYFEDQDQLCRTGQVDVNCDILNQTKFLKYMKENGFPNYLLYGDISDVIFLHVSDEEMRKAYEEYLLQEVKRGNVYPHYYALVVDRHRFDTKQPTVYGSYYPTDFDPEKPDIRIAENRKKIGLSLYFRGPNNRP